MSGPETWITVTRIYPQVCEDSVKQAFCTLAAYSLLPSKANQIEQESLWKSLW